MFILDITHCVVQFQEDQCVSCVPCKTLVNPIGIPKIGSVVEVKWTDDQTYQATVLEIGTCKGHV